MVEGMAKIDNKRGQAMPLRINCCWLRHSAL